MFSSNTKEIVMNPLHCRIPLQNIPIGIWVNLSIDVLSFVAECFKNQTFRSIDFITITANCKIRKIFSMRNSLVEINKNFNEDFPMEYADVLPKTLSLPHGVTYENINLNVEKLKLLYPELEENSNIHNNVNNTPNIKKSKENFRENSRANNFNPIINQNKVKNIIKPTNIRSKSNLHVKIKNNNLELLNHQEFIENYNSDAENGENNIINEKITETDLEKNELKANLLTNNNANIIKNSSNNSKKITNIGKTNNATITSIPNTMGIHSKTKTDKSIANQLNLINSHKTKNSTGNKTNSKINNITNVLNNANVNKFTNLNFENRPRINGRNEENLAVSNIHRSLERWESRDNGADEIEEIYEIEERENDEKLIFEKEENNASVRK